MIQERIDLTGGSPNLITAAEAKEHLRIVYDYHDEYIKALCLAVEDELGSITGVVFRRQRVRIWDDQINDQYTIPVYPVTALISLTTVSNDGTETPFSTDHYAVRKAGGRWTIVFGAAPPSRIIIEVDAGYNTPVRDERARLLGKLLVAHLYHNNLPAANTQAWKLPWSLASMLFNYRYSAIYYGES